MLAFIDHLSGPLKDAGPLKDQRGVTAIEDGPIAGLIAVVIIGSMPKVATGLSTTFTIVVAAL
jgi:Flp pilus assembly pilin Flp